MVVFRLFTIYVGLTSRAYNETNSAIHWERVSILLASSTQNTHTGFTELRNPVKMRLATI